MSSTCEDMKPNSSCFEDGGFAGVVSGVGRTGIPDDGRRRIVLQLIVFDKEWWFSPDDKMALCFPPILGDHSDPATWRLVRHNLNQAKHKLFHFSTIF